MRMTPERRQQIERLFEAALELEEQNRAAFIEEACGGDESLRREVEALLAHKEKPEGFMASRAADHPMRLPADSQGVTQARVEFEQGKNLMPPGFEAGRRLGEFGHYRIVRLLGKG